MIDVSTWLFGKLSTDEGIVAIAQSNVFDAEPETKTIFPAVYYRESNQPDIEFLDDYPTASDSTIVIDVYVQNASPSPLAQVVANFFYNLTWACTMNQEITDSAPNIKHRHMEFTRSLLPSDLT